MSQTNKELVTRAEDAWNEGNLEEALGYFADDYTERTPMPGLPPGKEGLKLLLGSFRTAFPDGHVTIDLMIAEDDLVCYHSTARGTHEGEFLGMAPTGRRVEVGALHVHRVRDGKIVEHWAVRDDLALMKQLGVISG